MHMSLARNVIRSPYFLKIGFAIALIGIVGSAFAQAPMRRQRRPASSIKAEFVTFPNLPKAAKFKFYTLDHTKFNWTYVWQATLPKGFAGKLKAPQQVLFLCYGFKKGGNTRLYETPAVPGVTPEQMTRLIADARIFKDVNRDDKWQVKGTVLDGVFVTSTSNEKGVNDAALSALTLKHWLR